MDNLLHHWFLAGIKAKGICYQGEDESMSYWVEIMPQQEMRSPTKGVYAARSPEVCGISVLNCAL